MFGTKANTFIKTVICCLLSIFLLTGYACQSADQDPTGKEKNSAYTLPEGAKPMNAPVGKLKAVMNAQMEDVSWIDVRTKKEFSDGYIEGAVNIDIKKRNFEKKILELDTSKTYYMYCRSGRRSDKARNFMMQHGFRNVYNVTGGMLAWKKAGYPLVTAESK